jgi:hypothetical protein
VPAQTPREIETVELVEYVLLPLTVAAVWLLGVEVTGADVAETRVVDPWLFDAVCIKRIRLPSCAEVSVKVKPVAPAIDIQEAAAGGVANPAATDVSH